MKEFKFEFPHPNEVNEHNIGRAAPYHYTFGVTLKQLMQKMFGGERVPILVKGTMKQVKAFARALVHEKDYYKYYKKYGFTDPKTYRSRYRLQQAIRQFERRTGMKWPLKHK